MKTPSQEEAKKECCDKCANGAGKYALAIARPYCLNKLCPCHHSTPPRTEESWEEKMRQELWYLWNKCGDEDAKNHHISCECYLGRVKAIQSFIEKTLSTQKAKDRAGVRLLVEDFNVEGRF
jgi:hypothetical protein